MTVPAARAIGRSMPAWFAAVAAFLAAALGLVRAQGPTFRAETDVVRVDVTVTDRRAGFVTDLTQAEFEVLEDGRRQTVTHFERGVVTGRTEETHVGLLLDTSGSMDADIGLARTAAVRFLNTMRDAADMTLVEFDTEVRVARYGQQDFPRLVERIRSRKPRGLTAMYDALGVFLDGAAENTGRTVLVLFTDGGDTRSTIRFGDVVTLLRASSATVHAIGFLDRQPSGVRAEQRSRLTRIAQETGGEAFFPRSIEEVDEAYDRIVSGIAAQYSLGFTSDNAKTDGAWRRLEVKIRRPGLAGIRLHMRRGYFAPYRQ